MVHTIGQHDIADILTAFEHSPFERLVVTAGTTRIEAVRSPAGSAPGANAAAEPLQAGDSLVAVRAPRPGVFRRTPTGSDRVEPETVLGSIRTRRALTPVHAGHGGRVVRILAADGDFVEYGQALLEVEPAGGPASGGAP